MGFIAPIAIAAGSAVAGKLASKAAGGLFGHEKELAPSDVTGFRANLLNFLQGQGFETGISGRQVPIDLKPYQDLFAQRRAEGLAQAKESAGTLTGSGFANILGSAAGRSIFEENAFLANLLENARRESATNYLSLLGASPRFVGQTAYQPGFLDYLFQGASAAAPLIGALRNRPTPISVTTETQPPQTPQPSDIYGPTPA